MIAFDGGNEKANFHFSTPITDNNGIVSSNS